MKKMIIQKSKVKAVLPEEVAFGNYFYAEDMAGDSRLCRVVGMDGVHPLLTAAVPGEQDDYVAGMRRSFYRLEELYVVSITEDWFKANPQVFTSCPNAVKAYVSPEYAKVVWCYAFSSKTTPNTVYYVYGLEVSYKDKEKETELLEKKVPFLQAEAEACGKAIIVQVAYQFPNITRQPIPFANMVTLNQLQQFLTICGIPDAFKFVPEDLVD